MFTTADIIDLLPMAAMAIALIATSLWGRKMWWQCEAYAVGAFAAALIIMPGHVFAFQVNNPLDVAHTSLLRSIGAVLVGSAATTYLARRSSDEKMFGQSMLSRIVTLAILLVVMAQSYMHMSGRQIAAKFLPSFASFSCTGVGAWLLGTSYQLLRSRQIGAYTSRATFAQGALYFDYLFVVVMSMTILVFPSQMLKSSVAGHVDAVHVTLYRILACFCMQQGLQSHCATGFMYAVDKRCHVYGRILSSVLMFCVMMLGYFSGLYSNSNLVFFCTGMNFVYTGFLYAIVRSLNEQLISSPMKKSK